MSHAPHTCFYLLAPSFTLLLRAVVSSRAVLKALLIHPVALSCATSRFRRTADGSTPCPRFRREMLGIASRARTSKIASSRYRADGSTPCPRIAREMLGARCASVNRSSAPPFPTHVVSSSPATDCCMNGGPNFPASRLTPELSHRRWTPILRRAVGPTRQPAIQTSIATASSLHAPLDLRSALCRYLTGRASNFLSIAPVLS